MEIHWALVTLIALWVVGVVSFGIWLYKKVIPDVQHLLEVSGLTEDEQAEVLSKTLHPPRFNR